MNDIQSLDSLPWLATTKSWSRHLGISTKTLSRWEASGKLPRGYHAASNMALFTRDQILVALGLPAQPTTQEPNSNEYNK
jgi:hypothetical protein